MTGEPRNAPPVAAPMAWKNIPAIRGAAIAAMVLCHSTGHRIFAREALLQRGTYSTMPLWDAVIEHSARNMALQCVPVFLFVSGFIMARFAKSWKAAWEASRRIALRYLLWSVPGFALTIAYEPKPNYWSLVKALLTNGPYYGAYWFLVLLIQVFLLLPPLVTWTTRAPRSSLSACLALLAIETARHYYNITHGFQESTHFILWRLPFFWAGVWMSLNWAPIVSFLMPRRRFVLVLALIGQVATSLESYFWGKFLGRPGPIPALVSDEIASIVISSFFVLMWALTLPNTQTRLRSWLDALGRSSLAILLMSDLFHYVGIVAIWHVGDLVGLPRSPGVHPPHFDSLATSVILFGLGLLGPVAAAELIKRWLGARVHKFVVG